MPHEICQSIYEYVCCGADATVAGSAAAREAIDKRRCLFKLADGGRDIGAGTLVAPRRLAVRYGGGGAVQGIHTILSTSATNRRTLRAHLRTRAHDQSCRNGNHMVLNNKFRLLILFLVLAGAASVYAGEANGTHGPVGRQILAGADAP